MTAELVKAVERNLKNTSIDSTLPPGSPRRWEPEQGIKKHNEHIHRESKYADDHKNLPFSFSKPKRDIKCTLFVCNSCGEFMYSSINTVGVICRSCKKFVKVSKVDAPD